MLHQAQVLFLTLTQRQSENDCMLVLVPFLFFLLDLHTCCVDAELQSRESIFRYRNGLEIFTSAAQANTKWPFPCSCVPISCIVRELTGSCCCSRFLLHVSDEADTPRNNLRLGRPRCIGLYIQRLCHLQMSVWLVDKCLAQMLTLHVGLPPLFCDKTTGCQKLGVGDVARDIFQDDLRPPELKLPFKTFEHYKKRSQVPINFTQLKNTIIFARFLY